MLLLAVLESISGFSTGIRAQPVQPEPVEPARRVLPVPKALQVRFPVPRVLPALRGMSEPQAPQVLPLRLLVRPVPPAQQAEVVHPYPLATKVRY